MLVKEIMTRDVKIATPEMNLITVATLMRESDCGSIPVTRGDTDQEPVGIITDRDIVIRAVADGVDLDEALVGEYMTASAVTVSPEDSLEECLETMEMEKIKRVVVVDRNRKCIGIVSQAQIARNVPEVLAGELLQEMSR